MNLNTLNKEIRACQKCSLSYLRKNAVPGEGNKKARIFFLGESPGRAEDLRGKPFVGMAGRFLDKMLSKIGLFRSSIFITGALKCHPPKNRSPKKEEIKTCLPWTFKQIEIIKPKMIVCLGRIALNVFLPNKEISKVHGQLLYSNLKPLSFKLVIFPTFHPAAAMRFPKIKKLMEKDFKQLRQILNPKS